MSQSLQPGVDLVGIVKDKQHLNSMPGEGPRKVIASADTSTAEATKALELISLATPGRNSPARSAKDGERNGGKGKISGRAAAAAKRHKKQLKRRLQKQL